MDDEPGVRVAVSNTRFLTEGIDRYYDREHIIDTAFADEESLVVYFHFAKNGAYKGMTYYFGSGDGCGFCYDGSVQSTVKIASGRLKGKIKLAPKPGENSWDIDLDVPVAPASHGDPLPAGGGEPGKAYAGYHAALAAADPAAAKPYFDEETQADFARARRGDRPFLPGGPSGPELPDRQGLVARRPRAAPDRGRDLLQQGQDRGAAGPGEGDLASGHRGAAGPDRRELNGAARPRAPERSQRPGRERYQAT